MQWIWCLNVFLCLAGIDLSLTQQTADKAANDKTKQILAFIAELPQKGQVLSGQFAGYSPDTFNPNELNEMSQQTGQIPAILGCDYAGGWNYKSPPEYIIDYSCNPSLKEHWNNGGLVTVNHHLPNPVSSNGGGYKERWNLNFADLTNSYTETGQRWRLFLDRIAQGLGDLQQAGVTVLYRPLHEMNGDWFYWCDQDPEQYKNVWRDMFDYFTYTKQLHNILWVYSPDQSRGEPSKYYPGDSYVDIVGLDAYTDNPDSLNGYYEMLNLNKPFALAEVGPSTIDGQFDYTRWISAIEWSFPRVSYFLAWNDGWSPMRNKNAYAFYNNQRILNRGQFNTGSGTAETATSSSSFLYNFSDGTAEWQGSNIAGGPWQSNELVFQSRNSLKADIQLTAGGQYALYTQQSTSKLSGRRRLRAQARTASWGFANNGYITAKLYVKAGSAWNWYDSGSVQLNGYTATEIVLDLNRIPSNQLNDIKEIGIQYESNASGDKTSVYLSSITME